MIWWPPGPWIGLAGSLPGLLELLTELHAKKVDLYLHQQGLDTSTPSGRAMFQMMGVFAEFECVMIREWVMAGLARARQAGTHLDLRFTEDMKEGSRTGCPSYFPAQNSRQRECSVRAHGPDVA